MKNNPDFSLHNKIEIYFNQYNNKYNLLESQAIPNFSNHISYAKTIRNVDGLIVCPYCINCYIHPGKQIVIDIAKKYNVIIKNSPDIFNTVNIRPGEYDFIVAQSNGGTNSITNGIVICSQCFKLKNNLSLKDFFHYYFMYSGNRYFRKNLSMNSTEIMDIDNFKNKCYYCNLSSDYKICVFCAGKKNQLIGIAN